MALDVHPQLLRALVAVLDRGSLTAASEQLGFTQSAVSKQIAALEASAGAALVVRGPRGVAPTDAGRRLAARATVVLDQLDAADRELRTADETVQGRVALGGFATAAARLVPMALARVAREQPGVRVEFLESSTPVQLRRLRAGRLDLALVSEGPDLPAWDATGLTLEPLPVGELVVAVPAAHPLAGGGRVDVDDLAAERWVVGRGARGEPQFGAWPTLRDPIVVAELGDWTARLGFVAAGIGITTVPTLLAGSVPPGVVVLGIDDPGLRPRSLLLVRRGALTSSTAAVRSALLREAALLAGV